MIQLCCKRLFLLLNDFSSNKTEQLFSPRLSNFFVSSDMKYPRCYNHVQLKSNIYDEAVHHKYTKAPKGSYRDLENFLLTFVFPNPIIRSSAEDPQQFAHTVHFASGKFDRSLNKSLQNVDIMEYQTLQFHDDFAEGSKCQFSLFVFSSIYLQIAILLRLTRKN